MTAIFFIDRSIDRALSDHLPMIDQTAAMLPLPDPARRRLLQGALAAGVLTLTPQRVCPQSLTVLDGAPRQAPVIGNSRYPHSPLNNPGNDARAIAGELKVLGFEVTNLFDVGRKES